MDGAIDRIRHKVGVVGPAAGHNGVDVRAPRRMAKVSGGMEPGGERDGHSWEGGEAVSATLLTRPKLRLVDFDPHTYIPGAFHRTIPDPSTLDPLPTETRCWC